MQTAPCCGFYCLKYYWADASCRQRIDESFLTSEIGLCVPQRRLFFCKSIALPIAMSVFEVTIVENACDRCELRPGLPPEMVADVASAIRSFSVRAERFQHLAVYQLPATAGHFQCPFNYGLNHMAIAGSTLR